MEARPIQSDDYAVLTYAGKSQTFVVNTVTDDEIYLSPLTGPTQLILLTGVSGKWKVQGSVIDYQVEFKSKEEAPIIFTNVPELDIQILNNLEDDALTFACQVNKYAASLCQKDELWEHRVIKYFPRKESEKPAEVSWKDYYLTLSKGKGNFYVVVFTILLEYMETILIGVYRTKKSAANAIIDDAGVRLEIEVDRNPEGIEIFMTPMGTFTEVEWIEEILKRDGMVDGMVDEGGLQYKIFEYNERDIGL